MSFDEIEKAWHSPLNQPTPAQLEKDKMQFNQDLRKRHHGLIVFNTLIFAALAFFTIKVILHTINPDPELDTINFSREWAIIPFFALPWIGWAFMARQFKRHLNRHENYEISIQSSLRALLDENKMARTRAKFIAGLLLATALMLPLVIHQLKAVGKAGNEINVMYWLVPIIFTTILLGKLYHYRHTLLPKKAELETLLSHYETEPAP